MQINFEFDSEEEKEVFLLRKKRPTETNEEAISRIENTLLKRFLSRSLNERQLDRVHRKRERV